MKLSVFKNNTQLDEVDLSQEIIGIDDSEISFYIGRSEDCHIHLDDQKVSREHARISFKAGSWKINQISGYGGLIVNGVMTSEKELLNGDVVSIGPYVINTFGLNQAPQIVSETVQALKDTGTSTVSIDSDATETMVEEAPVEEPTSEEKGNVDEALDDLLNDDDGDGGVDIEHESPDFTSTDFGDVEEGAEQEESPDFTSTDFGSSSDSGDDFDIDGDKKEAEDDDEGFADEATGMFSLGQDSELGDENSGDEELFGDDNAAGEEGDYQDDGEYQDGEYEENYDDDYAVDDYDDDKTQFIQSFARIELEIFGELAPFDKFVVDKPETIIGRDPEKCDIVLNDPEVSGRHAAIKKNNITCFVEDLNSGNGTLLNGERINKSALTNNDEFIIGSTTFTVHVISDLMKEEKNRLMPVEENQSVEVEEIVEVSEDEADSTGMLQITTKQDSEDYSVEGSSAGSQSIFKDPEKRRKLLIGAVVLAALWVVFDEEQPTAKKTAKGKGKKSRLLKDDAKKSTKKVNLSRKFNAEELEFLEGTYLLAKEFIDQGKYREALTELDKIDIKLKEAKVDRYKQSATLKEVAKQGLAKLEELERKQQEEIDRKKRMEKVKMLVEKAKTAVKERKVQAAEAFFAQIAELDPDNFDVPQLKIELDAWKKEQERKAIEKAQKEAERKRMVDALAPGKTFYLKKEWYKAILKLEDFLRQKQMDEDLVQEATKMLEESKTTLSSIVDPLIGKARSLSEGQDLKGAYEVYGEVLETDPTHDEALNEMNDIREKLTIRSRKIYREAIISESLSLFDDAKEKFQEVQQISPKDSEYYKKASAKLKDYLD